MSSAERTPEAGVVPLAHQDLGGEGKPPLVILHGLLGSSRNWLAAGRLLAATFHVFALDLRSHGRSPHSAVMSYRALARDVAAWCSERRLADVVLLGHSLGGKVAMRVACDGMPWLGRLVVVDIAPRDYPAGSLELDALRRLDATRLASRAEADAELAREIGDAGQRQFLLTNLRRAAGGGFEWQVPVSILHAALPALRLSPLVAGERSALPALFVCGGTSAYVRSEDHEVIRRHFPAARIEVLATSGHNPHVDDREGLVRLVAALASPES